MPPGVPLVGVVFSGDFLQLPPVDRRSLAHNLSDTGVYEDGDSDDASSDGAAIGNRQSTVDNRQSTIDSSGGEAWRTTRQDITVWNEVLTANGVDKAACQDLFLLAQHSSDGYKEANHIISKLIKKQQDKQLLTNTSAFVHKCVLNVRHKLMSQANDSWSEYSNAGWMDAHGGEYQYWHWR